LISTAQVPCLPPSSIQDQIDLGTGGRAVEARLGSPWGGRDQVLDDEALPARSGHRMPEQTLEGLDEVAVVYFVNRQRGAVDPVSISPTAKGGPALGYAEAGQDLYRRRGGTPFALARMDTHDTESGRGSRQHEDPMTLVQAMRADVPTLQPDVSLREIDVFQLMDALCSPRGAAGPEPEYSRRVRGEPCGRSQLEAVFGALSRAWPMPAASVESKDGHCHALW